VDTSGDDDDFIATICYSDFGEMVPIWAIIHPSGYDVIHLSLSMRDCLHHYHLKLLDVVFDFHNSLLVLQPKDLLRVTLLLQALARRLEHYHPHFVRSYHLTTTTR
jgi:hypothetical protein